MFVPNSLFSYLKSNEIKYDLYHHQILATAHDCQNFPDMKGTIVKNLVLKNKNDKLFLYTLPLFARADLKMLAKEVGSSRLSFGSSEDLAFLGIPAGMVSPLCVRVACTFSNG